MKIILPEKVKYIIDTLEEHGFEAYAVGGCVRDSLLSRTPQDWDITTSAKPQQVKALFSHTIDTGILHGTVTVMLQKEGFEVTTYRIDGEYEDGRHPTEVQFTSELSEDLRRRDFTINAMAYHEKNGLIDAFDGLGDLNRGMIRCVGMAKERFTEDALRMLRAVRFAGQLGCTIETKTYAAMCELAPNLAKVSAERIQAELVKLLVSKHPEKLLDAYETGLTRVFLPEFDVMMETVQNNPHHCYTVGMHTIEVLKHAPAEKVLRLAALLHDVAKPVCLTTDEKGIDHFYGHPNRGSEMAYGILRRLKFDNETTDRVCALVKWHDDNPALTQRSIRRSISRIGILQYPALFELKKADVKGQSVYRRQEKLDYIDEYEKLYQQILEMQQCLTVKELAVNGSDLIQHGMKPGKQLGETLKWLLEMVLEDPEKNKKETLLALAAEKNALN